MKIYLGYDESGNIVALAVPSDDVKEGNMGLDPEPGQHAGEFEVNQGGHKERHELFVDLVRNYRVERSAASAEKSSTPARLVKRSKPGKEALP